MAVKLQIERLNVFESVVFTLSGGQVIQTTEHLFADMAGLSEERLTEEMMKLGFTPLLRISSLGVDQEMPILISFTKRKIFDNKISAEIQGM